MASLGSLVIELAANTARLSGDFGRAVTLAERAAGKIKAGFAFLGIGASGGLFGNAIREAAKFGDELQKGAARAGTSAGEFSKLAAAAKQVDVEIGSLSIGIKNLQNKISEASSGNKTAARTFAELGIPLEDLRRRKPEQQLALIADQLRKIKDPTDRARLGTDLLSRAYLDLVPLLEKGSDGLRRLIEEQVKLGATLNDEQINRLAKTDDQIKKLSAAWSGFARALASEAAPALTTVLGLLQRGITAQEESLESLKSRLANFAPYTEEARLLREQIALLERRNELEETTPIGTQGQRQKRFRFPDVGVDPEKLRKQEEDAAKERAKYEEQFQDMVRDGIKLTDEIYKDSSRDRIQDALQLREELQQTMTQRIAEEKRVAKAIKDIDEELAKERKEKWMQTWGSIFENWYLGGQRTARNLGKAILAEILSQKIKKALEALFDAVNKARSSGSSSSSGGFGAFIGSVLGSVFGGGRAMGGPVIPGKAYLVGERGPEYFSPGMAGHIMTGGGPSITITNHMDFRGADPSLTTRLPAILDARDERLKFQIIDGLQRKKWRI